MDLPSLEKSNIYRITMSFPDEELGSYHIKFKHSHIDQFLNLLFPPLALSLFCKFIKSEQESARKKRDAVGVRRGGVGGVVGR
jgi:hypothetical protein